MKNYLIEIREKGNIQIFIMDFDNRKQLRQYLNINWGFKKYKKRVFILKECIIDEITKKRKEVLK